MPVTRRVDCAPSLLQLAALVVTVLAEVDDGALVTGDPLCHALGLSIGDADQEGDEEGQLHL